MNISDKEVIKILEQRRRIDQAVINAMQARLGSNPIKSFFWRKPWKATRPWFRQGDSILITLQNIINFIKYAHDCQDPASGCSCSGSFRFPGSK